MKKLAVLTIAVLAAAALSAQAADVKENWEAQCAKCHGADGKGQTKMGQKLKAKDYTDAKVQADLKDDEMVKVIKEGAKDKETGKVVMKGSDLSDTEIKAFVPYIRAFKK